MKNGAEDTMNVAIYTGDLEKVKNLIEKGADVNIKDHSKFTPLHETASCGKKDMVELLINKGADVNAKDISGNTALSWAVHHGYTDIVKMLLAKGADVNAKNPYIIETVLETAIAACFTDIVDLLRKHGAKE